MCLKIKIKLEIARIVINEKCIKILNIIKNQEDINQKYNKINFLLNIPKCNIRRNR